MIHALLWSYAKSGARGNKHSRQFRMNPLSYKFGMGVRNWERRSLSIVVTLCDTCLICMKRNIERAIKIVVRPIAAQKANGSSSTMKKTLEMKSCGTTNV